MAFTTRNHYVPQWYQRRFIDPGAAEQKLFRLDLTPGTLRSPGGHVYAPKAIRRLGPVSCFVEDHLYTLFFGAEATDIIERKFFGEIDSRGANAVEFFTRYSLKKGAHEALNDLIPYLDAQKLRTPKGLDHLQSLQQRGSHQTALQLMGQLFQMHATMWMEGVWEVLDASSSPTKFIISDHPVTTYNKGLFPLNPRCRYPHDPPIELVGTHTMFPLGPEHCLVITNLGYVRDPERNPTEMRENPRHFGQTIFNLQQVQTGRRITEQEVLAINYILKKRARRYLAAGREEWLSPEHHLKVQTWDKLGGPFSFMPDPRKVPFSSKMMVGYKDGSAWGMDEYGRRPATDDAAYQAARDREWESFDKAKQKWDRKFGLLPPGALYPYL